MFMWSFALSPGRAFHVASLHPGNLRAKASEVRIQVQAELLQVCRQLPSAARRSEILLMTKLKQQN